MLKGILHFAHYLLEESIDEGEVVIDATCGNGNDTLFLSRVVGKSGHVYAFDIQQQAIQNTKQELEKYHRENVTLIHGSHSLIDDNVQQDVIGGAIFNLGYLPRSDKSIITKPDSTIEAIQKILAKLKKDGLIVIVVYYGHDGGANEKEAVLKHVANLDQKLYNVLQYGFVNQKNNPPFILAIQKR
ncbi:methyltransferase domain-containing protein [Oceanobacillus kimchii]|uniref:rRNA methylase YtqB n=1 Tax=Oceanobacillus kimchii TaxID=746691 RepID=A0ABQ5TLP1_9BACI|nr:class I SAM-dependent methyltransferase [Oceanobacillus kimchii]MCT1579133.1 methyltransferase domain-containing protein [Oceanobacillus kimchii]MCT2137339.1 methyltransferase domain-containing protein [Oceanobacillus kimchii]GLO66975.1 putative rRNA methylase YtqB [Oceanobacillus kimchii]